MLPKLVTFEYIHSTQQRIIQSNHKYLTLHKYSIFVPKYLRPTRQIKLQTSSRGLGLAQSFHYLVSHHRGFLQILIELCINTIRLCALPKCIKRSLWPVGLHQPEYMSHVLSGGCGDIPYETFGYFSKLLRQSERFAFIPFRDLHNL